MQIATEAKLHTKAETQSRGLSKKVNNEGMRQPKMKAKERLSSVTMGIEWVLDFGESYPKALFCRGRQQWAEEDGKMDGE